MAEDDQVEAAASHISRAFEASGHAEVPLDSGPLPPWLASVVSDQQRAAAEGRLFVCDHLDSPGPVIVFADQPESLRCPQCAHGDGDLRRCAGCAAPSGEDTEVALLHHEAMIYSFHWCPRCQPADEVDGAGPAAL